CLAAPIAMSSGRSWPRSPRRARRMRGSSASMPTSRRWSTDRTPIRSTGSMSASSLSRSANAHRRWRSSSPNGAGWRKSDAMQIVYSRDHERHQPKTFIRRGAVVANPEVAARATTLLEAVRKAGHSIVAPDDYGPGPREAVHGKSYLDFLATIHDGWQRLAGAAEEVVPNIHP